MAACAGPRDRDSEMTVRQNTITHNAAIMLEIGMANGSPHRTSWLICRRGHCNERHHMQRRDQHLREAWVGSGHRAS